MHQVDLIAGGKQICSNEILNWVVMHVLSIDNTSLLLILSKHYCFGIDLFT
jgi:hypothetical protein